MAKKIEDANASENKTEHVLLKNIGSKTDGSPKNKKGTKVKLTKEEVIKYKRLNLIR